MNKEIPMNMIKPPDSRAEPDANRQTNRPMNRVAGTTPQGAERGGGSANKGGGSAGFQPAPSLAAGRISRSRLAELAKRLSGRDMEALRALRRHRFLQSGQVQRLFFYEGVNDAANATAATRALKKLRSYGLIKPLERRIGGVRAGSSSLIWHLTEAGERLLHLNAADKPPRKRFEEPSPLFLEHTLAVAECAVQLVCICRKSDDLKLVAVDPEPSCWRFFKDNGEVVQLKPDLFAVTNYDNYEDRWFIEIDLSTESPTQVVEKCKVYRRYFYTGKEQEKNEVFPLVVWIVKDAAREARLRQYIRDRLPPQPKMFLVITADKLEKLMRQWIEPEELC